MTCAGVLAMDPEIVVADEPTACLDPEATTRLLDLVDRLHGMGRTICVSTHDLELALARADEVVITRRGELLAAGWPTTVLAQPELLRAARLVQPIVLDTFGRLRDAGFPAQDTAPPRTAATLSSLIEEAMRAPGPARPTNERNTRMNNVVLDVPAIDCAHCAKSITKALQPQTGVKTVRVDVPTQKVHLEFDEGAISLDKVKQILAEEDYPVEAVASA